MWKWVRQVNRPFGGWTGTILFVVGFPGLIDDSGWWAGLVKKASGMTIPDYIYAVGTVLGAAMVVLFTSNWWLPRLGFNHISNNDAQAFADLVPLIEEVIRFKQEQKPPFWPDGVAIEREWRLDAELHALEIPHPDLKSVERLTRQVTFLTGLLACANRGVLEGARSSYPREPDDLRCDWEPGR